MLKAIFFDLDGTIRHNEPRGTDVFAEHAALLGLRVREDDLLRAMRWEHYYWANSRELIADREAHGHMSDDHWKVYSRRQLIALGASGQQADELAPKLTEYMNEAYKPENVVPHDLVDVLELLESAGYRLGVISNRDKPLQDVMAKIGLSQHFPYTLASGEINTWKPDPGIFLHACQQLGIGPAEAAYVGDNWFADVVGAKRAGVLPILYDPRGIFDEPECDAIRAFSELPRLLGLEAVKRAARAASTRKN